MKHRFIASLLALLWLPILGLAQEPDHVNSTGSSIDTPGERTAFKTALQLENVNNTSDANKPVSTATQAALDAKASIVPFSIPNLAAWWDPAEQALADGASVATWTDRSGNARSLTQATGANQPVLRSYGLNGVPAVVFDGSNDYLETSSWFDATFGSAMTFVAVMQPASSTVNDFFAFSSSYQFSPNVTTGFYRALYRANASNIDAATAEVSAPVIFATTYDGAVARIYINGVLCGERSATTALALTGVLRVGARDVLSDTFEGAMGDVLVYRRGITIPEMRKLTDYLLRKNQMSRPRLAFDGDSLMAGSNNTAGSGPTQQALALLGGSKKWLATNSGISGSTAAALLTRADDWVDPVLTQTGQAVYVVWTGANDLGALTSPATIYANIRDRCLAVRKLGVPVVVCTCIPYGANGTVESNRITLNASTRGGWSGFADALVDLGSDPYIGQPGANTDTTYFLGDTVHLNDTGAGVAAGLIVEGICRATGAKKIPDTPRTLRDAATILLDAASGHNFQVTLAGNRTLGAPINGYDGQQIEIVVVQDATGNRTLAYNAAFETGAGITLSTAANSVDRLTAIYRATTAKWVIRKM